MVVFGAGASYDPSPTHAPAAYPNRQFGDPHWQVRLPLADQLFEERLLFAPILERFPRALDVVTRLRHLRRGQTVESVMEDLRSEADRDPRIHRQLAAIRYYLQSAIGACESAWDKDAAHGESNYKTLLAAIELRRKADEAVCLVTFNYDTMLEVALSTVDVRISAIDEYVTNEWYKVVKLHGSVNWGRQVEPFMDTGAVGDEQLIAELTARAAKIQPTEEYHLVWQRPMVRLDAHRPVIPAIAVPLRRKHSFECPAKHLEALDVCLREIDRLLVIGWRATDEPFLELLRTKGRQNIRALVVAGHDPGAAPEVIANLAKGLDRPGQLTPSPGGFSHLVTSGLLEAFLDS